MKQELIVKREQLDGDDSIVIKKFFKGLEGGRTLYVPADFKTVETADKVTTTTEIFTPEKIKAGTPIVKCNVNIGGVDTPVYMAVPIKKITREYSASYSASASKAGKTEVSIAYDVQADGSAKAGQEYKGILQASILKSKPAAAVMNWGVVNPAVEGLYLTPSVQAKIHEAVNFIDFQVDEEA